ncbi:AI-2E family transporter [Alkalitalea saponilacus]|uniref:Predicted PurR-regulated permease PerM n=1 Tax=Alkalitalea saponilacus TaxID=889453 RepID=A0A1T5HEZ1_9BACT|nr:AI-2E family transporter [Alkalitalea saponilacus]ASB48070.1 AI-2E family transporter [Alkalitalea saponilacus]SKC19091.1 Predicted PurR-regulated permease PerM [Alkalitalea saponilacus]
MSKAEKIQIKLPPYLKLIAVLFGIVLVVIVMKQAKSVLVPILIAGFLAILISPFTSWMEKKGIPSALACISSLIGLLVILSAVIYFFYNQIIGFAGDLDGLERRFGELVGQINDFITANFEGAVPISMDNIKDVLFQQLSDNVNTLTQGIIATAGTVTMIFIIPVYIFLFLYFRSFLIEFVKKAFSEKYEDKVNHGITKVKGVVQNYIKGAFIVICILAVLNSIALYSLGIKHALLFAVFAAFLNVIPFLGPFLGATFPILFALLTKDSLWYPFGVFLAFYVIQLFESNLFTPKIVGSKVSMNPLMTIIALFIGNYIWGLAGMILFIPGIAILKVIFDEIDGMEAYGFLLGAVKSKSPDSNMNTAADKVIKKIKNIKKKR